MSTIRTLNSYAGGIKTKRVVAKTNRKTSRNRKTKRIYK